MTIRMGNLERLTLAEMEEFVTTSRQVTWSAVEPGSVYKLIERVLKAQQYRRLSKGQRGIVRRFLNKVTALSRAQLTRLIQRWMETRRIERKPARRPSFHRRYSDADIASLAEVDAAHEDLSGPAVRHLCQRAWEVFGDQTFKQLASISASHIYNLRRSAAYRKIRVRVQHTQGSKVSIGERRQPEPKGRPGYLRVDTVHQGQHDGEPGLYHLNAVDTVTQWQVVGGTETISERHLIPVLEAMLHQFPFRILGFHCDNGSEFLNHNVVKLLNKLLVEEFTKSRAYRTTDNALVEGKNGAVVRKQIGYGPIGAEHAEALQKFYAAYFNPYLNFHRPCGYATVATNPRGKRQRSYRHKDYRTPYEKLTSLEKWTESLKPGITAGMLKRQAEAMSDTEAARRMQKAKLSLLACCRKPR
ncbi:MAG: integrase [Bryobacteraceae bacterium]